VGIAHVQRRRNSTWKQLGDWGEPGARESDLRNCAHDALTRSGDRLAADPQRGGSIDGPDEGDWRPDPSLYARRGGWEPPPALTGALGPLPLRFCRLGSHSDIRCEAVAFVVMMASGLSPDAGSRLKVAMTFDGLTVAVDPSLTR
jgi:hypothetical protein